MRIFTLFCLLCIIVPAVGQEYSTSSKRAEKNYEKAAEYFRLKDDATAEEYLQKALKADENFIEAWFMMAQIYLDKGRGEEAVDYFLRGLEVNPDAYPEGYLKVAGVEYAIGKYTEALKHFRTWNDARGTDQVLPENARRLEKNLEFAAAAVQHPVPFDPRSLGEAVNSDLFEYWPSLSVDENTLFMTVLGPQNPEYPPSRLQLQEDFYYSERVEGDWCERKNLGPPVNTNNNEGAQTVTADGGLIFFTACNRPDGHGSMCDLYVTEMKNGRWSAPKNLGDIINTRYSEKHPAVSADGRTLIFASNRPGGRGDYDLWMSRKEDDAWGAPENLGDSINTWGAEQSPFIHPDQQTLYFASDGWPGMGRTDLFISRLDTSGSWSTPENLGYPINTHNEEVGLVVNARGTTAYYSSNRRAGTDTDIFSFELPEKTRPAPVSFIKGRVYDARTMRGIAAIFQLIDLETGEIAMESTSSEEEGAYFLSLPSGKQYAFNVSHPGYLFYSDNFSIERTYSRLQPFIKDIPLEPVMEGKTIVLKNIFYDTDDYTLREESKVELEKVIDFLKENPSVRIEISGHTDDTGTPEYNRILSENRAKEVVRYLAGKDVDPSRLVAKGYGETLPVADNSNEKGRALNRRTELKILSLK
jgi:outer membrane protein OmpA-like peptidoglycan-associated protein